MKKLFRLFRPREHIEIETSFWRTVFAASAVNGYEYKEPTQTHRFQFPKQTWFQQRLEKLRGGNDA